MRRPTEKVPHLASPVRFFSSSSLQAPSPPSLRFFAYKLAYALYRICHGRANEKFGVIFTSHIALLGLLGARAWASAAAREGLARFASAIGIRKAGASRDGRAPSLITAIFALG